MSSEQSNTSEDLERCLEQLARCCAALNMPVFLVLQESEKSFRSVLANEQYAKGAQMKLLRTLVKAGNLDQFLRQISIEAQKEGHSSLFLKAIGIPENPS